MFYIKLRKLVVNGKNSKLFINKKFVNLFGCNVLFINRDLKCFRINAKMKKVSILFLNKTFLTDYKIFYSI